MGGLLRSHEVDRGPLVDRSLVADWNPAADRSRVVDLSRAGYWPQGLSKEALHVRWDLEYSDDEEYFSSES